MTKRAAGTALLADINRSGSPKVPTSTPTLPGCRHGHLFVDAAPPGREKRTLLQGLCHFLGALWNVPTLIRVNALTRTVGLANFRYAVTLAAHARDVHPVELPEVQRRLRRHLGLSRDVDIVASVLIGRADPDDAAPAPEMFRRRKPVAVDWIRALRR